MYSVWLLILCTTNVFSTNILYISPVPSPSHHIWNRIFGFELAKRGHNVTFFSPDNDNNESGNYSHILMDGLYDQFNKNINLKDMLDYTATQAITEFVKMCMVSCEAYLESKGLQFILNYPSNFKFSLIIFDVSMGSCLYPLLHRFDYPPAVAVTPFLLPPYVAYNFGNLLNPSYTPWYNLPYSHEMTFMQRVWNSAHMYTEIILRNVKLYKDEHEKTKQIFGEVPPMEVLERHFSLLLTNTNPILNGPQPLAPNVIAVGGLHTRKPSQVPQDLLTILDGATNGVILFSLGTNIRSDQIDHKARKAVLDAFSKIKETVIWKFESTIDGLPKNVIVREWLPQNDILGHPNVKLLFGHGGGLSIQEAIYHGVPIICVPFMLDQHFNAHNLVAKKLGILLEFRLITTDYVLKKLREILDDPTYVNNVRKLSRQFRDQAITPLDKAVFWAEYVMRHGGANFSTSFRDSSFYSLLGLDVCGLLIVIIASISIVVFKLVKLNLMWINTV